MKDLQFFGFAGIGRWKPINYLLSGFLITIAKNSSAC